NPHPKQIISKEELQSLEQEVYILLGEHGVSDDTDQIKIEPLENNQSRKMHMFKLKIQGESFKGTFHQGKVEWFHPKPMLKLKEDHVEKIEEKVIEKMHDA